MDLKCKITVHTYIMKGVATNTNSKDILYFDIERNSILILIREIEKKIKKIYKRGSRFLK